MTSTARTLVVRAGQVVLNWREQPQKALVLAGGGLATLVLLILAIATVATHSDHSSRVSGNAPGDAASAETWHYFVVCSNCGYRTRTAEHPSHLYDSRGGQLQCPSCGQFAASWFRRGSLAVPPGGWDIAPTKPEPNDVQQTPQHQSASDAEDPWGEPPPKRTTQQPEGIQP